MKSAPPTGKFTTYTHVLIEENATGLELMCVQWPTLFKHLFLQWLKSVLQIRQAEIKYTVGYSNFYFFWY